MWRKNKVNNIRGKCVRHVGQVIKLKYTENKLLARLPAMIRHYRNSANYILCSSSKENTFTFS